MTPPSLSSAAEIPLEVVGQTVIVRPRVQVPRLPGRGLYTEQARGERIAFLREQTGASLRSAEHTRLDPEQLCNNIEDLIGGVEIPVGAAGPLEFHGTHATGSVYCPLATTEGALLASTSRGARAVTSSGGVYTHLISQRMQRVPVFIFYSLAEAVRFEQWLRARELAVRDRCTRVSRHARLVELQPVLAGRCVHVRFVYETGDAAGQNMTTACTWHACQWILRELQKPQGCDLEHFFVDGNLSSDKKASFSSFVLGRGSRVTAEARIDGATLQRLLKVDSEMLLLAHRICVSGAQLAGMPGYTINAANIIAGVFAACGQDIACVHESSMGVLQMEPWQDGVYMSLLLPALIVGSVGGGTHLEQQQDYLELLGCAGTDGTARLSEIVAGFCLALDLSTLSAVASGQFASAHERLGRNRPVQWLTEDDLTPERFQLGLCEALGRPVTVTEARPAERKIGSSVITELTARRSTGKLLGFFPRRLTYLEPDGSPGSVDVMAKVKPLDREVTTVLHSIASACGPEVRDAYRRHMEHVGLAGCHLRELAIYRQKDPRFRKFVPQVYGVWEDPSREVYALVLENLKGLELMDSADDLSGLGREHLEAIADGLGPLHSVWWGRVDELVSQPWLGAVQRTQQMRTMDDLWTGLACHAREEFPSWVSEKDLARWLRTIQTLEQWWPELECGPRTLIHNDFNPRNVAFRRVNGAPRPCVYDWELATLGPPQRDLAEYLCFALGESFDPEYVVALSERQRRALEQSTGDRLNAAVWQRGFVLSLRDLLVNRIALYCMAHTCRDYAFLPRVFRTLQTLLDHFDPELSADGRLRTRS